MKKLIYLTGTIESPFFTNEIAEFSEVFDEVFVIVYDGNKMVCNELSEKYGFKYEFVYSNRITIKDLFMYFRWRKQEYVVSEFKKHKGISLSNIKKKLYDSLYGIYLIKLHQVVDSYIQEDDEIFVYSFWLSRSAFGAASFSANRMSNVCRIVSRTHRYDLYEEENDLGYLPFRKYISESLDTIYFSSRDTIQYFDNKHYFENKKPTYKLAYLGTRPYKRKGIDVKKQYLTIGSCSYIIKRKRLDLIIEFIVMLKNTGLNVKWIHIGDGELEKEIKALAVQKLCKVSYCFTGRLSDEEIYKLYEREDVDLFVNLSDSEGVPVSIMEALSMGIPVITRDVGGNSDAVINEYNGYLIKESGLILEEMKEVSFKVADVFKNKERYKMMSDAAYHIWREKFYGKRNAKLVALDIVENNKINKFSETS